MMDPKQNRSDKAVLSLAGFPDFDLDNAKYADLILWYLRQIGVRYVFGIPGGAIAPFYDALARAERSGEIHSIVARHEAGASFMADGYTRESGVMGVCCATTGPGATNLITGVASAYENETPQLVITAQTPLATFGKTAFQESSCTGVNILGMFQYCTRYNSLVSHVDQLETKLISAIMAAHGSPRGPVHLSIPVDILKSPVRQKPKLINLKKLLQPRSLVDQAQLPQLLDEICHANKIVCVIGTGCSGVAHTVLELINYLQIPVITSTDGKGLISPQHPLFRGVFGFAGHATAVETLQDPDVDLVLVIGTNLSEWATGGWDEKSLLNGKLIHVDSVPAHFVNSAVAKLQVVGSIGDICRWLVVELHQRGITRESIASKLGSSNDHNKVGSISHPGFSVDSPEKCYAEAVPIKPQRLMTDLGRLFPPNTRFLADTGNSFAWATHYLHAADRRLRNRRAPERGSSLVPGRRMQGLADTSLYRASIDFASMGWAIGAAIGTAMANSECPVVCITGDGSFLMSGQEITVALQCKLTIVYVILNDQALGMVKHGQILARDEAIGYQLPAIDYSKFAEAMGIKGYSIVSPADLESLNFTEILNRGGPTLLDVHIDPDEVPPIGMRVRLLEKATKAMMRTDERG